MSKDEDILNSFCVLAFDEVPSKNFTLKEYINRKADSADKLNLVEKHLIAKEVSKNLKDASAFYDQELPSLIETRANFKRQESVHLVKTAKFGDVAIVGNKYHLVNPLTKRVTAEYIKLAADANFAKLHNLIGQYRKDGKIDSVTDLDDTLVLTGAPEVINELEHLVKDIGYYCEAVDESTGVDGEVPSYSLKIFIGKVAEPTLGIGKSSAKHEKVGEDKNFTYWLQLEDNSDEPGYLSGKELGDNVGFFYVTEKGTEAPSLLTAPLGFAGDSLVAQRIFPTKSGDAGLTYLYEELGYTDDDFAEVYNFLNDGLKNTEPNLNEKNFEGLKVDNIDTTNPNLEKDNPTLNTETSKEENIEKSAEEKIDFEKEFMESGESEGKKDKVNETQLAMGKEVEKEHTTNPEVAEKITRDHLAEIPDYYTHLEEMEENAKKNDEVKSSYAPFITVDATEAGSVKVIAGEKIVGNCKDVKAAFEKVAGWSDEKLLLDDGTGVTVTYQVYDDESKQPVIWAALRHRDKGNIVMCSDAIYVDELLGAEEHIDFVKDIEDFSKEFAKVGLDDEKVQHYQDLTNTKLKEIFQSNPEEEATVEEKPEVRKTAEEGEDSIWVVEKTSAPTLDGQAIDIFYVVNKNTHEVANDAGFEPFIFPTQEDAQEHADKLNSQKEASAKPEVKKEAGESYGWVVKSEDAWDKLELWKETVGAEQALDDIAKAMGTDELSSCLAFIFRNNDFREGLSKEDNDVESAKEENIDKESKVVKQDGKYQAQSEKGKNFGTYDTKEEAEKRVQQMEMFKHMDKKNASVEKQADDQELKQFDMKQELDGQKEFEKQDDFSQVSVPEEKEDTSEVTETMEAKPEETKGESFSASEFGNNLAYIQQNNPEAFQSIMNNLKQIMVGDEQKIYDFLENWAAKNFQDFTAMTREDPTYARHSQYQEQLKNNVLPKLKEMQEYKQAMEEKVSAEKGNVESAKAENIEKKADKEEYHVNIFKTLDPDVADGFDAERVMHDYFDSFEKAKEWADYYIKDEDDKTFYEICLNDDDEVIYSSKTGK